MLTNWQKIDFKSLPTYPNHFTVSAVVIEQEHILLVHHKRIGAWLPPGGHIESTELPHQAALREVLEETGIEVEVVSEAQPITGSLEHFFLPMPLCMHAVLAKEKNVDLYHLDLAYVCKPIRQGKSLPVVTAAAEVNAARWVSMDNLEEIPLANNVLEIVELAKKKLNLQN